MPGKSCTINLIVNGQRWLEAGESLVTDGVVGKRWTLAGLQDYVQLTVGSALGFTIENTTLIEQRWCRARAIAGDGEAVAARLAVAQTPHITEADAGAGLALEAVEAAALSPCDVVVMVGATMAWHPLRQKLEAASVELFELLLPPAGKVVVSTERVIDLRQRAKLAADDAAVAALFKRPPVRAVSASDAGRASESADSDEPFAANSIRGTVKLLANGYGIVSRADGRGEVQFLASHVQPPGFEFVEVGDELRFDVVEVAPGKWRAQRVVRS
jgi:cold shock CspA family protein